jgi:hypothetical protein
MCLNDRTSVSDSVNCTTHYVQKKSSATRGLSMAYCASFFEYSTKIDHNNNTVKNVDGNIHMINIIKLVYLLFFI